MKTVHLGFEVGNGNPVEIPLRHLAVTGQTQEAGKTTTLEGLIERSGCRAVAFTTKRGEGSFRNSRTIPPYFEEQADWQYVASILEASRGERMKFERSWIIRASKGARTLADVQRNVRKALETAKGISGDVYLCLDAYLDAVVPQIARVKWSSTLELADGVNVMDLSGITVEMQHLVIRSTITRVLNTEAGVVVVVPEAWKFIPQGRGTPVKLAAEAFIRQGAALGNYLWLDSQDLGGIEKAILRSVSVWLLGVQREANEIKRTLDNIPNAPKPKPTDIALLELGQFFACWGRHAIKTYVQPAWMTADEAQGVARTGMVARHVLDRAPQSPAPPAKEEPEMCELHQKLERELESLRGEALARLKAIEKLNGDVVTLRGENHAQHAELADFRTLKRILGSDGPGPTAGSVLDEEALVQRVLARVPAAGGGPIQVTPPEALRLQVQKDVAQRLVNVVRDLPPTAKRLLRVLIAVDKRISQRAVAERAGAGWGGSVMEAYKALSDSGLIESHPKNGTKANVRERIVEYLGDLGAQDPEVEAVYQNVLYQLATGDAAAA